MRGDALLLFQCAHPRPLAAQIRSGLGFALGVPPGLHGLFGAARTHRVRGRQRRRNGRSGALTARALVLSRSLFALAHPLRLRLRTLATFSGSQFVLVAHQGGQGIVAPLADLLQTVRHGETLLAIGLLAAELLLDGRALRGELGWRGGLGCSRRDDKHQGERAQLHVSPVSTSRRASARYSAERISCRRDTVRGNSCASGPSV